MHVRRASEKTKKRMKMADLKTFVETKLLSKSDKALEKIGQDEPKLLGEQAVGSRNMISVCIKLPFSNYNCTNLKIGYEAKFDYLNCFFFKHALFRILAIKPYYSFYLFIYIAA